MEKDLEQENDNIQNHDKKIAPIINILFIGIVFGSGFALQEMGAIPEAAPTPIYQTEEEQNLGLHKTHHTILKEAGTHFVKLSDYMPSESLEGYTLANNNGENGFINTEDVIVTQYVDKTTGETSYPVTGTPISKLNIKEKILSKKM